MSQASGTARTVSRPPAASPAAPLAPGGIASLPVDWKLVAWMGFLTAVWGSNMVSIKVLTHGMAPVMGAGMRGVVALACLTALGLWRRESLLPLASAAQRRATLHCAANGLLFALEFLLVYRGAAYTNAGHMSIFLNTAPFWVAVGAHLLLPGDRLTRLRLVGLLLAFIGVVLLFSDDLLVRKTGFWRGDLMVLVGASLWAATTVYLKRTVAQHFSGFQMIYVQILVSTPVLLGVSLLTEPDPFFAPTLATWLMVLYQGGFIVFFTYLMWNTLLRTYPASAVQSFTFLTPGWGVLMGVLLLGEQATLLVVAGLLTIAAGLWLVNRPLPEKR